MSLDFTELLHSIKSSDFEEVPVWPEEFIYGYDYLDFTSGGDRDIHLSEYQLTTLNASTQILKRETLHEIYGFERGEERWSHTKKEVIMVWGKGSGKDMLSTLICAYIVYVLLCMKDPSKYYGTPADNSIDIINVAINAQQANNVFFKNFASVVKNAPWFRGRYDAKVSQIDFDKNVHVYSGHSEREAFEGYNTILIVLDEIDGFKEPGPNAPESSVSAPALYEMYKHSLTSRFPDFGKLLLLSFPRRKAGFIMQRYNDAIVEKEVVIRSEVVKIDPSRPDDIEENELTIEWEEDHIGLYKNPNTFALKRPSWEVNPRRKISDYTGDFISNYPAALGKYACMPPESLEGLFRDRDKVELAFRAANGVDNETGNFEPWFKPDDTKRYYVHVDLAKKHDRCVVTMAHVERFEKKMIAGTMSEPVPRVIIDCIRYWTPTKDKNVDFAEVRNFIVSLRQRGFNVRLVTFDQWSSSDMIEYLRSVGIRSEKLGVNISQYTDLIAVVQDERLVGPRIPIIHKELLELRLLPNGKVDHPRDGSSDLADSAAGAVFNAIAHTPRNIYTEIEIVSASEMLRSGREVEPEQDLPSGIIRPPGKVEMPPGIQSWIDGMKVL